MPLRRPLLTACALLLLVAGPLAAAETEHFQRTIPLAPGGTLKLHNFSGRVTITGTDRGEVTISATRTASRDLLDRIKLDVTVSGTTVEIEANKKVASSSSWFNWHKSDVVDTEMEIQVPRHTNLKIDVFSSPVVVTNVEGTHRAHGFSSDIRMTGVNGPIKADTFSGRIDVELAAAAIGPNLTLETFSGDIDVRVPQAARATVAFNSFSGDLTCDSPMTFTSKSRHSLHGDLSGGASDASITLKTFSGDARILKPR
jgi:DUF4097 and DUF4098 domain-containing protein YvlB